MTTYALSQFFLLYTWFALTALFLLLLFIARFYEHFSGETTRFRLFLVPSIAFGAAAVRYSAIDRLAYDPLADILLGFGGIFLLWRTLALYRQMTRHRQAGGISSKGKEVPAG